MMSNEGGSEYPRPLELGERELIEALLGGMRSGAPRFLGQLESVAVVGRCRCGCPSIDLQVGPSASVDAPRPVLLADAESPEGVPVGVILWARGGALSGLEVHPWDGAFAIRLPRPETLRNVRTTG
jgi:hypothetical protein